MVLQQGYKNIGGYKMEDMASKGFDPDVEDIDNSDVNEYNEREILVAKRKGTYETFKVGKLADSIFAAAAEVGGEDLQIADDLATEIQDMLESNDIHIIEASDLHDMVYKCLVDNKHAATSERYLTESIKRSNQREMDTALMKSFEEITFKSEEDSEVKRENANIDSSTAMGTMLKYGSEAAKNFNLLYLMTPDVANAHRNGDIHIHDLDFLSLTETCITDDTMITLRENGEIHTVPAKYLNKFLGNTVDNVVELNNVEIMSHGKFVKAINCVKYASDGKRVLQIKCKSGELNVTDEHRVTVVKDGKEQDIKAKDLSVGDSLLASNAEIVEIESINEIEYTGFVYDLETEDHHFDANGFVVHNCMQIPLDKLFDGGFNTGHGYLRQPGSIRAAAAQAAIAIQSDQNDQHGGQSIPLFDYYLAPYVALTYVKQIAHIAKIKFDLNKEKYHELKHRLVDYQKEHKTVMNEQGYNDINDILVQFCEEFKVKASEKRLKKVMKDAYDDTYYDTYQAMEAFIHNLNTMHSRAGAQVPFSSINYGTDTSTEGRMVMETILKSTWDGLGNGEIPIFPIQIFKLKAGVSYNKEDPNYDLFELSCKVSAKRLYPNFVNLDAPYNAELYVPGHPETEMATMGCVESSEILRYTIDGLEYIETFEKAYNRISNLCKSTEYSYNSDYIDVSDIDVKVKDSVHGFVKVKKFIKNKNVNNFNVIKFSDGYSLTATSDHPLPVVGKGRTFVKDLSIGDKVEVSRNDAVNSDNKFMTAYFKEYTYLLGVILADASYKTQICISLGLDEKDAVDYIESIVDDLGYRLNVKEQHRDTKGDYFDCCIRGIKELRYAEKELASIFGGYKKAERTIPSSLLTASRKYRLAFLAGLMDADGHVTCSKNSDGETERSARFSIGSTNKTLAMTELALIRGLGYKAKMYRNKYSSKHSKIRYLIEFEITDELLAEMHCGKKINKANTVDRCEFSDVDVVEVVSITSGCEENELNGISYDLETESDMLDISYISSHNCRTRVSTNKHDLGKQVIPGRGNLSFTSINLPRLAIMSNGDIDKFYKLLDNRLELVHKQLLQRFELQCLKHPINYPFLMGQGVWIGSDLLGPNDDIRDILKNGTLGVGFIGLAETLTSLIGEHHGQSERAEKLGLEIIQHMRDYTDAWSENEHMNYGVIGTPAEGLSGRFVRMDKKKFGVIPGVTDKEYYTNSSHIPVSFPISATKKIQLEAPFHAIENGGHILYIEMDGDPTKNVGAFMKVVRYMHDNNAGYFAINHPVDRDPVCNYTGIIDDVCPRCGRKEGEPMTMEMWKRIHQTAGAGNICTCGACGDPNEEADRISNAIDTSDLKFDFE